MSESLSLLREIDNNFGEFNDHEILGQLGKGASSVVEKRKTTDGFMYASKKLKDDCFTEAIRELGVMTSLIHPRIVSPIGCFYSDLLLTKDDDNKEEYHKLMKDLQLLKELQITESPSCPNLFQEPLYILYPLMEENLGKYQDDNFYDQWDLDSLKDFSQDILLAVSHIHKSGLVHRDIKPENILIRRNHEGKKIYYLGDFGLARKYSLEKNQRQMTQYHVVTLWWRSLEILRGSTTYGPEIDIFSLGCIFLELLIGTISIFQGDTARTQKKILEGVLEKNPRELIEFYLLEIKGYSEKKGIPQTFSTWQDYFKNIIEGVQYEQQLLSWVELSVSMLFEKTSLSASDNMTTIQTFTNYNKEEYLGLKTVLTRGINRQFKKMRI